MWCNETGKQLLPSSNTLQKHDDELKVGGRSNFYSARLLPLHRLSALSDLRSRGFKMLILSTLKPWGTCWTSEAHLSRACCQSVIKQRGRSSLNASANLPANVLKAHTHVIVTNIASTTPIRHLPQDTRRGLQTHIWTCTHTLNVI